MTSSGPTDNPDDASTVQWMEGLTGRGGSGSPHSEGQRLRAALAPTENDRMQATWADIEARARAANPSGTDHKPMPEVRPGARGGAVATNDRRPRLRLGWAAAVMVVAGMAYALLQPPQTEPNPAFRGVPSPSNPAGAQWVVEHPQEAAEVLAAELRQLQAEVVLSQEGPVVTLHIHAQPEAAPGVNARLAVLETGLDAQGRLHLTVAPVPPPAPVRSRP